ncbi:HEAT repeat domain-containing protein [Thalassoroseus pseudoceratinae]|uniref:HEAT repeat domain-containing protein n=1 Tax=Thalassoroseus pseudoceratinae TaxID=2713176 RepID=UPI00141DF237|nr:HEAT repeat domain-containing protein [Thalassoroseus pseudoceratinae]
MQRTSSSQRNQWSGLLVIGMIVGPGCGSETPDQPVVEKPTPNASATAANGPVVESSSPTRPVVPEKPAETELVSLEIPTELELPTELPTPEPVPTSTPVATPERVEASNLLPHTRILRVPTREAEMTAAAHTFQEMQVAYESQKPDDYQVAEAKLLRFGPDAVPVLLDRLAAKNATTESTTQQELASMMLLQILPETLLVDPSFPDDLRIRVFQVLPTALSHPSADVRINIATALSLFQDPPPQLVPALRGLLKSEAEHHRLMALIALGNLGPHSAVAMTDIRESLKDESADVREAAKRTLDLMATVPTARQ